MIILQVYALIEEVIKEGLEEDSEDSEEDFAEDLEVDLVVDTEVIHTEVSQTVDIKHKAIDDPTTIEVKTATKINILAIDTAIFSKGIISVDIMTEEINVEQFGR